jgi:hypothetical protein
MQSFVVKLLGCQEHKQQQQQGTKGLLEGVVQVVQGKEV